MLHDQREKALFPELPAHVMEGLPKYGQVLDLPDGAVLFTEGEADYPFYAVVEGQVRITKAFGSERQTLALHGPGHFCGEISMLTGGPAIASAHAVGPTRVVRIEIANFRKFAGSEDPLAKVILTAMAARSRDVEVQARQQDKLASLGKLSAGLAHELNNPASAAGRAARTLQLAIADLRLQSIQYDCRFTEPQRALLLRIGEEIRNDTSPAELLDSLERSDREQELEQWLDSHGIESPWELAPTLVDAGFTLSCLNSVSRELSGESLTAGIGWLETSLRTANLADEVQSAVTRVAELVGAMKEYTYMDRADLQETDIHRGLDSTLTIFAPRLKNSAIRVERQYAPNLPLVCAHPGELNQVWTNLIDNALDAMNGSGTLTLSTTAVKDGVAVEIGDTGAGIPEQVRSRIFDPFFTTKGIGKGTGLGLDIVYRIVTNRHGGSIQVSSQPGNTRFEVRLPLQPPKENDE
jgi:signal transduction histidine kinase